MTIQNDHAEMVATLAKDPLEIKRSLTPANWGLLMEACRRFIEASQYLDKIKKIVIYNKQDTCVPRAAVHVPDLNGEMIHLLHMTIGIAGESGELMEAWFNTLREDKWDLNNQVEELGDLEFYLRGYYQGACINRSSALKANLTKLAQRYEGYKYSDHAAQIRADKAPEHHQPPEEPDLGDHS